MRQRYTFTIILAVVLFALPQTTLATSGACSYHGGVDCGRGWQADGRVYCNDGWDESSTYYDFTAKCQGQDNGPSEMSEYIRDDRVVTGYYKDYNEEYNKCLNSPSNERYIDKINRCSNYASAQSSIVICPINSQKKIDSKMNPWCICDEGYSSTDHQSCVFGNNHLTDLDKMDVIINRLQEINQGIKNNNFDTIEPLTNDQICKNQFGEHFKWDNTNSDFICVCEDDYILSNSGKNCVLNSTIKEPTITSAISTPTPQPINKQEKNIIEEPKEKIEEEMINVPQNIEPPTTTTVEEPVISQIEVQKPKGVIRRMIDGIKGWFGRWFK